MPNVSLLTSGIGDVNQGGSLVPTGTVFAFAGATAPAGWLLCDGTAYNQADYASLFSVIGSLYNTQTNPTTNAAWATPSAGQFRVPDYRGVFLRSSGQASGQTAVSVGGHQSQATARPTTNFTGSISGTAASAGAHAHSFTAYDDERSPSSFAVGGAVGNAQTITTSTEPAHTHSVSGTCNITGGGDSETRPTNKGVLYIIKV
jgi:microcystin-dependent protein